MNLTDSLAIYAACLSTIIFAWDVSKAKLKVKVEIVFGMEEIEGELSEGAYIFTKNHSSQTVHLSNISILYPYKNNKLKDYFVHAFKYRQLPSRVGWVFTSLDNYGLEDKCPLSLEAGKSHSVFVPYNILEKILEDSVRREIKAVAQDQLWRNKYSPKFEIPKINLVQA